MSNTLRTSVNLILSGLQRPAEKAATQLAGSLSKKLTGITKENRVGMTVGALLNNANGRTIATSADVLQRGMDAIDARLLQTYSLLAAQRHTASAKIGQVASAKPVNSDTIKDTPKRSFRK